MIPTAELHRIIERGEKAEMHRWILQATGDDVKKYGAFIFKPFWGAVAVCPRESPQFSCHLTNMKAIEAARIAPDLARELIQAREALAAWAQAHAEYESSTELVGSEAELHEYENVCATERVLLDIANALLPQPTAAQEAK